MSKPLRFGTVSFSWRKRHGCAGAAPLLSRPLATATGEPSALASGGLRQIYIVRCEVFYMVKKNFQRVERKLSTCRKRTFNTLKTPLSAVSDEHRPLVRTAKPPLVKSGSPSRRGLPPPHNKSRPTSHMGKSAGKSGGSATDVVRGEEIAMRGLPLQVHRGERTKDNRGDGCVPSGAGGRHIGAPACGRQDGSGRTCSRQ